MRNSKEELDDLERCLQARRALERRFKTVEAFGAFIRREEKKSPRNIAHGRRLLAERDAQETPAFPKLSRSNKVVLTRRSA